MVGREIAPTEIGKHAKLIKSAQEEMSTMDVLVCGRCLMVYHFVEEFKQHKQKACSKENTNVRETNDTKPKIWAFLLWKATQLSNKDTIPQMTQNSWALYQTWVKMDESVRETWIVAGRTIQSFANVSQGNLSEMPVKITKTVVNSGGGAGGVAGGDSSSPGRKLLTQTKPQVANLKPPGKVLVNNSKPASNADSENESSTSPLRSPGANSAATKLIKKPIAQIPSTQTQQSVLPLKPATITTAVGTALNKPLTRRAKRTTPNTEEIVEENVEKIVAKRFNPRRRMHEYLVKWEARTLDQNTWEPASHLENVPHLLETFEKQLARQKETRAALQAKQTGAAITSGKPSPNTTPDLAAKKDGVSPAVTASKTGSVTSLQNASTDANYSQQFSATNATSERPQRFSKTKAMDNVKQWVSGNSKAAEVNSPNSEAAANITQIENDKDWSMNTSGGGTGSLTNLADGISAKRKLDDSDYNDSIASGDMQLQQPSNTTTMEDLEEDLIPSHTLKRMKYGNSVAVEVKTKLDSNAKQIKINGTSTARTITSGSESQTSAEIIITEDSNASGVVKKPGFSGVSSVQKSEAVVRVLSKGESAVSNSGIVRVTNATTTPNDVGAVVTAAITSPVAETQQQKLVTRTQHVRSVAAINASGGRSTSPQVTSRGGVVQQVVRTPGGTTIQRKTVQNSAAPTPIRGPGGVQQRMIAQQTSPSSGRMIIPRQGAGGNVQQRGVPQQKVVTPEQKILQLSKSGDLKVTKKVMTRDDVAQRQQQLQQRQRQQSQIHIQKVQQLSGPAQRNSQQQQHAVQRKQIAQQHQQQQQQQQQQAVPQSPQEEEHHARLCPITGNIIGGPQPTEDAQQELQMQQMLEQEQLTLQQQQQQQQQLQDIDPNLLLTQDQMLTNEDGTPLLVTGEDGTVYQVAGKNAEGQTILVTQGPDGEQQFAYVAAAEGEAEQQQQVLTLDNAVAEAVSQLPAEQQAEALAAAAAGEASGGNQYLIKTTQEDGTTQVVTMTEAELAQHQALAAQQQHQQQQVAVQAANAQPGATNQLCIQTGDGSDGQEANIPAEVVQAELPSPGGTRRVVLLLQDGTFMMTEMHDDEFKALNLAA